jgi:hypothetical protein
MPGQDMFAMMSAMAKMAPRETSVEKVRRALKILDEVREEDKKLTGNVSVAMDILTNGPELPDDGTRDEANTSSSKTSFRGIE